MTQVSLTDKLLAAKVPQLLGTYLAVGFGLLQFVEFVSNRYTFDNLWVDRYLLLWLGLIPAVALLIYYRGMPPKGVASGVGWKTGLIFTNLAVVLALLFLVDREAGPVTEEVAVLSADGQTEQRIIPARSAVQRIAVFDFAKQNDAAGESWWGTAYSFLLNDHLRQRPEVITSSPMELASYYDRFGAKQFESINVATQRKIAQRARTDFFVSLEYNIEPSGHQVKGALHRTKDGKAVQSLEASAGDIYGVVDRLKEQIDDFLPPLGDLDRVDTELPSSALITDKENALEPLVKGSIYFINNPDDPAGAANFYRASVKEDPSCANCTLMLATNLYAQGKVDSARVLARDAARLADVLPEREQFLYKIFLLSVNNQADNTMKVLESFRTLYPYDWMPYQYLETYYSMAYGLDSTAALMRQAADLSNRELALERLYAIHSQADNFAEVEKVIDELDAEFPDKDKSLMRRARLYQNTGRGKEAREVLQEMIALDPLNPEPVNQLISLETNLGEYERAEQLAREQLRQASTATDSIGTWGRIVNIYGEQGEIDKALAELTAYESFHGKYYPRMNILLQNFNTKVRFALMTGDQKLVDNTLTEIGKYDGARGDLFRCLLPFYHSIYDVPREGLQEDFLACKDNLETMGPMMAAYNEMTELLLAEDYTAAAEMILAKEAQGLKLGDPVTYARINRKAGRMDKAREYLDAELANEPKSPLLHLELARVRQAAGNIPGARESLAIVEAAYGNADADFLPAIRARELLATLAQ